MIGTILDGTIIVGQVIADEGIHPQNRKPGNGFTPHGSVLLTANTMTDPEPTPPLDESALEEACRRVAGNTMWNTPEPKTMPDVITSDEIEAVVARYLKLATRVAEAVEAVDGDPNLVVRAVDYMADQHAIPPLRDDTRWFHECLESIATLACPELTGGEAHYHPIHDDILYTIARARRKQP